MTKLIQSKINLEDVKAAEEILAVLNAPVNSDNILNLKVIINELGELYEAAYNKMLLKSSNERLIHYKAVCECGKNVIVNIIAPTILSSREH